LAALRQCQDYNHTRQIPVEQGLEARELELQLGTEWLLCRFETAKAAKKLRASGKALLENRLPV
jgi:hypothetical protein